DPQMGVQKRPVTSEICNIYQNRQKGVSPKRVLGDLPEVKLVGSRGETRIWFYQASDGAIELFDAPGFRPTTHEMLTPVTNKNSNEVWGKITAGVEQQRRKIELWLVRDGEVGSQCLAGLVSEITNVTFVGVAEGVDPVILAHGNGCYCGSIRYCRR